MVEFDYGVDGLGREFIQVVNSGVFSRITNRGSWIRKVGSESVDGGLNDDEAFKWIWIHGGMPVKFAYRGYEVTQDHMYGNGTFGAFHRDYDGPEDPRKAFGDIEGIFLEINDREVEQGNSLGDFS